MAKSIALDTQQIKQNIELYQRTPFQELLAAYIDCAPSTEAIKAFAEEYPDRYFKALAILTPLAGYKETVTHEHNYLIAIHNMPDSEIEVRRKELEEKLKTLTMEGVYEKKE